MACSLPAWSPQWIAFLLQVLRMEAVLLTSLKFCLTVPTPSEFGKSYAKAAKLDRRTQLLAEVRGSSRLAMGWLLGF